MAGRPVEGICQRREHRQLPVGARRGCDHQQGPFAHHAGPRLPRHFGDGVVLRAEGVKDNSLVKKALRILAVVVLPAAIGFWAARGAHRGWTINNIAHETTDPITGLTGVTYEKGFIPGWDFLAVAILTAGIL